MKKKISLSSLNRLCQIYRFLERMIGEGKNRISSSELGEFLGLASHNVRKDISFLGEPGSVGSGYSASKLHDFLAEKLQLAKHRNVCVVGLGRIGSAVLAYEGFMASGYSVVAGFDTDINLLDTIKTPVKVYPTHMIDEIVKVKQIELAVIAVPGDATQNIADRLIRAGIMGIVNFSPAIIRCRTEGLFITNLNLINEFTLLSAQIALHESQAMHFQQDVKRR